MVVEESEDLCGAQASPKVESILDRRKQLKRQRRTRFLQGIWRTGATLGLTAGLGWGLSQPEWKIRSLDQVSILGNTQLSTQTLEQLLPLTYPSSLIRIRPQAIAHQFEAYAHVEQVVISRQLFPPQVNIVIQERSPVAKTRCAGCVLVHDGQAPFAKSDLWLIDSAGVVLPVNSYPELQRSQSLPQLEIDGYLAPVKSAELQQRGKPVTIDPRQQQQLQKMLPLLLGSPVAVQRLDWREKANLKLKTPLGPVHLFHGGENPDTLKAQLEALDQLRSLPHKIDLSKVAYLNLSNPENPTLSLKAQPKDSKEE